MVTGTIFDDGNIGIGTTAPDHKLTVSGLAKFILGGGNIAMSTPGGWPGVIAYTQDGTRSDIVFDNDAVRIAKNVAFSAPSLDKGLTIHDSGNVGVGALNPVARLEVRGEVRTTSSAGATRLWGQGRPGIQRYGTTGVETGLCPGGAGAQEFGLSNIMVQWGDADAGCPAGTWVCTLAERGSFPCDTVVAPEDGPDAIRCDGSFSDVSNTILGWVADNDISYEGYQLYGEVVEESGSSIYRGSVCSSYRVWCCSGPN
jgi:hypothetical protein